MLEEFLRPYFAHSGELIVRMITFNLITCVTHKQYEQQATAFATDMGKMDSHNILFTLTSHSEDDWGNLMIGMSCQKRLEVASTVEMVLDVLLTPFEKITSDSVFIMFACRAIVNKVKSFDQFCASITRYGCLLYTFSHCLTSSRDSGLHLLSHLMWFVSIRAPAGPAWYS